MRAGNTRSCGAMTTGGRSLKCTARARLRCAPVNRVLLGRAFLMLLATCGTMAHSAVPAHVVQPKATADDPRFTTNALVLPDGALLAYYVKTGPGPTLVLVPETHGDRTQFYEREFLGQLRPDLQLVVIESRGQGRSWPPPTSGHASIEQYADDVLAVVRQMEIGRWYVAGHSLGGMIALEIAGRRPQGLQGVIALEGWAHHSVSRNAFPMREQRTEADQKEARRQREERHRTQRWTSDEVAALSQIWTSWQSGERILRELAYPLLSIWGDRGQPRPSRAQLLLPATPLIELHWIEGADHYVTDAPFAAQVGRAVTSFIARLERNGAPSPNPTLTP
jgi:pimeloyl-ACP methyl ester carboxylesterase